MSTESAEPKEKPAASASPNTPKKPNKLIIHTLLGTKGGVGKSTVATNLADWFKEQGLTVICYDLDEETSTFARFNPTAKQLDTHDKEQTDTLIMEAEDQLGKAHAMILDLRAGAGTEMLDWFSEVPFEELREQGIEFIGWGCTTSDPDSQNSVHRWLTNLKNKLKGAIIVRNLKDGKFDTAKSYPGELATIEIDAIENRMMTRLNERNLTLSSVLTQPKGEKGLTDTMMRARFQKERGKIFAEFERIKSFLLGI